MRKSQKEIELAKLKDEARELRVLKAIYNKAAEDVNSKLKITNGKIEVLLADLDNLDEGTRSVLQSQIYHKNFQEAISRQLNGFLNELNSNQYKSIDEYLNACYKTGFVGAAYELADQGIPLIMPLDQKKVVKAIKLDSKISKELYTKLGEDVDVLKKRIANNISRGIAFSDSYENIARNIRNDSKVGFNKAMRITRTEGHRVHIESAFDAMKEAQSKGADIVKQWNAQLDGKTRPHHRKLDGQIRELDEPFEIDGMEVMYPSAFGRPEEDINCRCVIHQRAKWALDEEELEVLKERASFHGLRVNDSKAFGQEKAKDFADFKKKYLIAAEKMAETLANTGESSKIVTGNNDLLKLSSRYLNKNDILYQRAAKIEPLEGFEDIVTHGDPYSIAFIDSEGAETNITAAEFVEMLKKDTHYKGGDIRLVVCQAGADNGIVPQYIANELGVNVLAPTEIVNVDFEGNMILADDETDARAGIETGEWKLFKPKGR